MEEKSNKNQTDNCDKDSRWVDTIILLFILTILPFLSKLAFVCWKERAELRSILRTVVPQHPCCLHPRLLPFPLLCLGPQTPVSVAMATFPTRFTFNFYLCSVFAIRVTFNLPAFYSKWGDFQYKRYLRIFERPKCSDLGRKSCHAENLVNDHQKSLKKKNYFEVIHLSEAEWKILRHIFFSKKLEVSRNRWRTRCSPSDKEYGVWKH